MREPGIRDGMQGGRAWYNFENTAQSTPQQNGRVDRKFSTFLRRVHEMLNDGGFD